jgi:neutral ceramidase
LRSTNQFVDEIDFPMVPNQVPMHLVTIGDVALAAVPAEFNAMAGKMLKESVQFGSGGAIKHVAIAGFSNEYSGYVTTPREYGGQHYEGASNLYGQYTLYAYMQRFEAMAAWLFAGGPSVPSEPEFIPTLLHRK